jgi:hypothetical protein
LTTSEYSTSSVVRSLTRWYLMRSAESFSNWWNTGLLPARPILPVHGDRRQARAAAAAHHPWPLRRAEVLRLDQDLLQRARLSAPGGDVLATPPGGVPVRIGMWHR